jgi:CheY-like chemotaxis protein
MPGIDGWETLRRLRAMHGSAMACAVVSANAFDRELPNDVGITPQDFHTKPVRHSELLLWLGRRLQLSWLYVDETQLAQAAPVSAPEGGRTGGAPTAMPLPAAELGMDMEIGMNVDLSALRQAVELGYVRGVHQALQALDAAHPQHAVLWAQLRGMAQQFDLEGMAQLLVQPPLQRRAAA